MITLSVTKELGAGRLSHNVTLYSRGEPIAVLRAGIAYSRLLMRLIPALAVGEGDILSSREFYNVTPEELSRAEAWSPEEIREIIIREFEEFGGDSAAIIWEPIEESLKSMRTGIGVTIREPEDKAGALFLADMIESPGLLAALIGDAIRARYRESAKARGLPYREDPFTLDWHDIEEA